MALAPLNAVITARAGNIPLIASVTLINPLAKLKAPLIND